MQSLSPEAILAIVSSLAVGQFMLAAALRKKALRWRDSRTDRRRRLPRLPRR